jgi:hypothetical protein
MIFHVTPELRELNHGDKYALFKHVKVCCYQWLEGIMGRGEKRKRKELICFVCRPADTCANRIGRMR